MRIFKMFSIFIVLFSYLTCYGQSSQKLITIETIDSVVKKIENDPFGVTNQCIDIDENTLNLTDNPEKLDILYKLILKFKRNVGDFTVIYSPFDAGETPNIKSFSKEGKNLEYYPQDNVAVQKWLDGISLTGIAAIIASFYQHNINYDLTGRGRRLINRIIAGNFDTTVADIQESLWTVSNLDTYIKNKEAELENIESQIVEIEKIQDILTKVKANTKFVIKKGKLEIELATLKRLKQDLDEQNKKIENITTILKEKKLEKFTDQILADETLQTKEDILKKAAALQEDAKEAIKEAQEKTEWADIRKVETIKRKQRLLGMTPYKMVQTLVSYAKQNNFVGVKRMVEAGVNVNNKNFYGYTALYWAQQHRNRKMIKYLQDHGATE